ncbi:hypothetical protein [Flavobacterium branchiicola]|uniref:Uncharacterized protein n=1 Tax=Flavobacterium branchiicola TaxID=1114875 RepID=A0ABV9PI46_9FLAO|nr:hypothetical protein [Flavobacterium branchiicola]MBS7256153.1 hypothetical protein [Flavobacterium branchiicola]
MKKVFLGMLLMVLAFGTMSLTTSSDFVAKTSMSQKEVEIAKVVFGPTYTIPWNSCCESPIFTIERDIVARGLPATTNFTIKSTTSTTVTYTIF